MVALALFLLAVSIGAFACSQLLNHGKFKWMSKDRFGFFGEDSYLRKYKNGHTEKGKFQVQIPLDNWYYNFFKIKYRESFPLSATFLVPFTDGYHAFQHASFVLLAASFSLFSGINFIYLWIGIILIHSLTYRTFQR